MSVEPYGFATTHEQRAFALGMVQAGASRKQAAEALGMTSRAIDYMIGRPRNPYTRVVKGATPESVTGNVCLECTKPCARNAIRCLSCSREYRHAANAAASEHRLAERSRILVEIAETTGFVPTAQEVADRLKISRSKAGDLVISVFGKNPRGSGRRRPYISEVAS